VSFKIQNEDPRRKQRSNMIHNMQSTTVTEHMANQPVKYMQFSLIYILRGMILFHNDRTSIQMCHWNYINYYVNSCNRALIMSVIFGLVREFW